MKAINRKIWDIHDLQFPLDQDIVFLHGENGSGKSHTLRHLKSYFEEQGENVLFFPDDRHFLLDPEQCNKVIRQNGGLRALFGNKQGFIGEHDIDVNLLDLENKYGEYIRQGKLQLANFFCTIMLAEKESVVIIDEPEKNIHLIYQRKLISNLFKLKNVKKIVCATHSPSIIETHRDGCVYHVEECFIGLNEEKES